METDGCLRMRLFWRAGVCCCYCADWAIKVVWVELMNYVMLCCIIFRSIRTFAWFVIAGEWALKKITETIWDKWYNVGTMFRWLFFSWFDADIHGKWFMGPGRNKHHVILFGLLFVTEQENDPVSKRFNKIMLQLGSDIITLVCRGW